MGTSTKDKKLDNLFLSVGKSLCGEPPFYIWPAPYSTPAECEFYLADDFLHGLYKDLKALEQKGCDIENIAKGLKNPSRIAQTLWPFGHVTNVNKKNKEQLVELASLIVDLLSFYRKDPFNQDGKNILWSQHKIDEYFATHEIIDHSDSLFKNYKTLISRLEGTLWLYSELLFFSIHEICKEFHGPYLFENGRLALIREYYDLKPEFWPFTHDLPYQNLLIFEIYEKGTEIAFDFFGRFRVKKPIINKLVSFSMMIEGSPILAYEDIENIYKLTTQVAITGAKYAQNLSRLEIMKKFIHSYYYILKPLKAALGRDWQPPETIFEDIEYERKKHIIEAFYNRFPSMSDLPSDKMVEVISKVFDPRLK